MSRTWNRTETWLGLVVVAIGGLLAAIAGLHTYITATATPLHPDPAGVPAVAGVPPPGVWRDAAEHARRVARTSLAEQNLPGLSVAVGVGDEIVWTEGFGWADLDDRAPVSPGTRFRIGTASMAFTSAAVGVLLDTGRLRLDDEIQTLVPEFPRKPWPVTLRQLMGHVAGVRTDGGDEGPLLSAQCERPADGLREFADRPLLFEPGTAYRASSYGWILVSAAVEAASGESFGRFMRERVFEPLGMKDTRFDSASEPARGQAAPYFPRYAADPRYGPDPMRPVDYSCYAGASGFVSTPADLVRFGMAMRRATLLKPATVTLLQTSLRLASGEETGYGLGWDLETVTLGGVRTPVVGHDGDVLGGTVASLMIVGEPGLVVAAISNTSYADTPTIARTIAEAFTRQAASPASP